MDSACGLLKQQRRSYPGMGPGKGSCTGVCGFSDFEARGGVGAVKPTGASPMKISGDNFVEFGNHSQERNMSIASISSLNSLQLSQPSPLRSQEDQAGRQLEQAIQSGDLAGAQQAFSALSAFGPNNSGPFTSPALSSQFAAVGQALQAGDLGAAKQAVNTLGKNLLTQDFDIARQDFKAGGASGAQQAIANLEGDYWAVTGQGQPVSPGPSGSPSASADQYATAVNVQA
jgi:hypothetical protein